MLQLPFFSCSEARRALRLGLFGLALLGLVVLAACSGGGGGGGGGGPGDGGSNAPDLVIEALSAEEHILQAGQRFTLRAELKNDGNAASTAAAEVTFYRSDDDSLETSGESPDDMVGRGSVPVLAAGALETLQVLLSLPGTQAAGPYHYFACVAAVSGETATDNNCSTGVAASVLPAASAAGLYRLQLSGHAGNQATHVQILAGGSNPAAEGVTLVEDSGSTRAGGNFNIVRYVRDVPCADGLSYVLQVFGGEQPTPGVAATVDATQMDAVENRLTLTTADCGSAAADRLTDWTVTSDSTDDARVLALPDGTTTWTVQITNPNSAERTVTLLPATDPTVHGDDYMHPSVAAGTLAFDANNNSTTFGSGARWRGTLACDELADAGADFSLTEDDETRDYEDAEHCGTLVEVELALPAPELRVSTPTAVPNPVRVGSLFTLNTTVTNHGDAAVPASEEPVVTYYQSDDDDLDTSTDTSVGTSTITGGLDASGGPNRGDMRAQELTLPAPTTAGTYHYFACVAAVAGEADTTNNCSRGVPVTVATTVQAADLTVGAPTGAPATAVQPGGSFRLSVIVTNDGTAATTETAVLTFYRSDDAILDPTTGQDTAESPTFNVEALAANADSTSKELTATAPATAGTYHYYACVAAVAGEANATNNCSPEGVAVTVATAADLVVVSPAASATSVVSGSSLELRATVRNAGGTRSAAEATLRYYFLLDADRAVNSGSDTALHSTTVGALDPQATGEEQVFSHTAPAVGTYYYSACVEAASGDTEARTDNNCSGRIAVTVTATAAPDLTVGVPTGAPATAVPAGSSFTLSAIATNGGSAATTETAVLTFYRSNDATLDPTTGQDTAESPTFDVEALAANADSTPKALTLTAPAGTYRYYACVATFTGEANGGNNCSPAGVAVTVATAADLVVVSPAAVPTSVASGSSLELRATVRNAGGTRSAAGATLRYYFLLDADRAVNSGSDTALHSTPVGALDPQASGEEQVFSHTAPAVGTYYYSACVEAASEDTEVPTDNNCSGRIAATVTATAAPDLTVGMPTGAPATAVPAGSSFTLRVIVTNGGTAATTATPLLTFYRSNDATLDPTTGQDIAESPTFDVEVLAANADSAPKALTLTAPDTGGTYRYYACVATFSGEANGGNNCSPAGVAVTVATAADLVVEALSVEGRALQAGQRFTLRAELKNDGNAASTAAAEVTFYRSDDDSLETSGQSADEMVGRGSVPVLAAGALETLQVLLSLPGTQAAGPYHYFACVAAVSGETATDNNCSTGVAASVLPAAPAAGLYRLQLSGHAGNQATHVQILAGGSNPAAEGVTLVEDSGSTRAGGNFNIVRYVRDVPCADGLSYVLQVFGGEQPTPGVAATVDATQMDAAEATLTLTTSDCGSPAAARLDTWTVTSDLTDPAAPVLGLAAGTTTWTVQITNPNSAARTVTLLPATDPTVHGDDYMHPSIAAGTLAFDANNNSTTFGSGARWRGTLACDEPADAGADFSLTEDGLASGYEDAEHCGTLVEVELALPAPELRVGTPTAAPNPVLAGTTFILSTTVINHGNAAVPASEEPVLTYYQSDDETLEASGESPDTSVGTSTLTGGLDENGEPNGGDRSAQELTLTAPATAGMYHYFACVAAVADERRTDNNCSAGVQLQVVVDDLPADTSTSARFDAMDLMPGVPASLQGEIEVAGDQDWFQFRVRERGKRYQIDLEGSATSKGTLLDPYLAFDENDPSKSNAFGNDDGGMGNNAQIIISVNEGTYYFSVRASADGIGTYTLSITEQ